MRTRVLAIVAALLLTGCAQPVKGIVTGKDYRPAYTYFVMSGKALVPIRRPECWKVIIGDRYDCAPKDVWDRVQVGDFYEER